VWDLGVRQMELVNKFDNALSGVAGDSGTTGPVVNSGNRYETGHYWQMDTCSVLAEEGHDHHGHDKTQPNLHDDGGSPEPLTGRDSLAGGIIALFGRSGAAPVYPEGPHCNTVGLRPLGEYVIREMMARGMIFDPDHMSAAGRADAMEVIASYDADGDSQADGYSGVISSHSWADETTEEEIWSLGGVVTPMAKSSDGFLEKWRRQRSFADPRFVFGVGYGADTNGFASQGAPRNPDDEGVTYPFEGFGGATVHQQTSGERTYDIDTDGVDHYGLYPDWVEDVRILAEQQNGDGEQFLEDMARASEAYLQMWERALGIEGNACREDVPLLTAADLDQLQVGMTPEQVLQTLGQPDARVDDTYEYCTAVGRTTLRFDEDGRLLDGSETAETGSTTVSGSLDGAALASDTDPRLASTDHQASEHDHSSHDHSSHDHAVDPAMHAAGVVTPATSPTGRSSLQVGLLVLGLTGLAAHGLRRGTR
ncbi:MAG: outer membrane protein assembly factor BamE, partial [Nitriliruptorales bacterium]|nr:outer membrane protein assembly factor BamE [Nitriliruptorales bacterium]